MLQLGICRMDNLVVMSLLQLVLFSDSFLKIVTV